MNKQPIISVVMPVYNAEAYLTDAIYSILNQTYSNLELIIINDGSTDNSPNIINSFAKADTRIYPISRENRGLVTSLNEGIRIARGRWIARMDADDIAMPDRLEKQIEHLKRTNSDICGGAAKIIGYRTKQIWHRDRRDAEIKLRLCFSSAFIHPTVMMRAELAKNYLYDESYKQAEDYELWTRLAADGFNMTNLDDVLVLYRVHGKQASHQAVDVKILDRRRLQKIYIDQVISTPNAFDVMTKFSDPSNRPTLDDAKNLLNIMANIQWASRREINTVFQSLLKYVKPANLSVYRFATSASLTLGVRPSFSLYLLIQSLLALNSDSKFYSLLKRFVN